MKSTKIWKALQKKGKEQVQDFLEKLVNAMLGQNVDDASVTKTYNDELYDAFFKKYHEDLSNALTVLGTSLHNSIASTKCSFGNSADEATEINIKDKIIDDWAPLELKRKLLEKERSLSDIIDLCQIHEQILDQSKVMGSCSTDIPSTSVNKISDRGQNSQNCFRCGGNSHVGSSAQCPARNAKCHKCELMGHFANKCKTKPRKRPNKGNYNSAKRGRMTSSRVNYLDPVTSDEEDRHRGDKIRNYECFKIDNGRHSHKTPIKEDELIECKVGGIPLTLLIDSGSKANIINGRDWEVLTKRQAVVWNIDSQSKNILKPYAAQQSLDIRHQFQTTVGTSDRREIITSFFVVDEGELSILGKDSAKRLGVLKLGLGVNCIQDVSVFPKVKNVKVSLTIDKTVKPVQQPLRRVPVAVEALVEAKLNEAIRRDIIEPVEGHSPWFHLLS
ncbi:hypothetical protein JTB14_033747 [Gonioctena quinquepunctata]|nr:hypothetical protein JTB14_033747 [Gonioctena quinquepunctata]